MTVPTSIADLTTSEATNSPLDSETITAETRPSDYIRAHAAIIKTHAVATAEHGATGAVVGTTNTQTLTNKTLTDPVINGVVTTTGLTMPDMTAGAINGTTIPTSKTLVATDTAASETSAGLVELATDAEAQAFTANKAIDGAKLNTAFKGTNQSLVATSGYQKLPGGLILQWGYTSFVDFSGTATVSITFPVTFPTGVLGITDAIGLTAGFNTAGSIDEASITTSGFNVVVAEWNAVAQAGGKCRWFAVGY